MIGSIDLAPLMCFENYIVCWCSSNQIRGETLKVMNGLLILNEERGFVQMNPR